MTVEAVTTIDSCEQIAKREMYSFLTDFTKKMSMRNKHKQYYLKGKYKNYKNTPFFL